MRPYPQSVLNGVPEFPGDEPGDCMRAAICSVLEIDPKHVPNFAEWVHEPGGMDGNPSRWFCRLYLYCMEVLKHTLKPADRLVWLNQYKGLLRFAVLLLSSNEYPNGHAVVVDRESGYIVHDPQSPGQPPRPVYPNERVLTYWGFKPRKSWPWRLTNRS